MALEITADVDTECTECGEFIPADATEYNGYHDTECDYFLRVLTEDDALDEFRDFLNDIHEPVTVCGYTYDAAQALERIDGIAFREEFLAYCDTQKIEIL